MTATNGDNYKEVYHYNDYGVYTLIENIYEDGTTELITYTMKLTYNGEEVTGY